VSTLLFTVVRRERDMIPYFRESSLSQNRKWTFVTNKSNERKVAFEASIDRALLSFVSLFETQLKKIFSDFFDRS
jgi:hypothetical protein